MLDCVAERLFELPLSERAIVHKAFDQLLECHVNGVLLVANKDL